MKKAKTVSCPTCNTDVTWSEDSLYRPFCSKRCRLIDLGEWLDEEKRIPCDPHFPPEDDSSSLH
jgi:endogenous inhibitor of DNA gyrase (YacG/DUF329 family)